MRLVAAMLVALLSAASTAQDSAGGAVTLTLAEVMKLVRAGVTEEVVIAKIKRYNKPFDLNTDEILELKKAGVSDIVVRYLLDPSPPYTPPPPPVVASAEPRPQSAPLKDPLILKLPSEPGMYWLASAEAGKEVFELIELKPVVALKAGKRTLMSGGLKKGHTNGFLVGPEARLRVAVGANVFYGRLGAKTLVEDLVLLEMEKGEGRRLIDFGPKPDKPVFQPDAIRPFESKQLAEGVYRLDVKPLSPGNYVFLILGSGDEKKGILGKGFDFDVALPKK